MVVPTPANPAERLAPPKDGGSEKHRGDLYIRTSWIDAGLALHQLEKGRITGGAWALWIRARLQRRLESLGEDLHAHAGKVLFVALLLLSTFCVGLKSAQLQSRVDQLWVQEGGRLEAELQYTRRVLGGQDGGRRILGGHDGGTSSEMPSTHQLTIQAPTDPTVNVLSVKALLAHDKALRIATSVTVQMFDVPWRLKDICAVSGMMNFERDDIDKIFRMYIPCAIITPLDCFWEGSRLHGPDYPVAIPFRGSSFRGSMNWTHLNPIQVVQETKDMDFKSFPFSSLEGIMKRAGITTGYQEKPCLNPKDPLCPDTAPNKKTMQPPDVAAELSGGCYGIAAKYMHWPEELIVGGGIHNKNGTLRWARALQTVVQLMTDREFYETYVQEGYKVRDIGWSIEKAGMVLDAWQRKFAEEIHKLGKVDEDEKMYEFLAFSTATLNDILGKFTQLSIPKIAIGYACILVYVAFSLVQWKDSVKSQAGVGIAGVLLLCMTVIAGLGFCSLLGIPFNASTMQIVPFLALGLGVDDMFLLTHAYAESPCGDRKGCSSKTPTVLRTTGLSVLLTSLCNVCAFFAAALIPIPALRVFSLQAAILLLFNLCAMLFVYPAMISLDMRRRAARRSDLLCCLGPGAPCGPRLGPKIPNSGKLLPPKKVQAVTRALPPDRLHTVTSVVEKDAWRDSSKEPLDPESNNYHSTDEPICLSLSLTRFAKLYYATFLLKPAVKVLTMLALMAILIASVWGATKVADGLQLTDIVPQGTDEHKFLSLQGEHFGFYSMYAITQGNFEYPTNQKLLYDYHESFVRIQHIMKNDNGGLPEFWLPMFRDWLIDLQKAFDKDFNSGCITQEKWFRNASDEAILAYKLLVQTGNVDNPIDKSLITQIRLVDDEGIINPKAFYNYLTAWASNDASAYTASQANMKPEPKQYTLTSEYDLKIPKSPPLVYTQLPFYLHGLKDTEEMKILITSVRNLCAKFEVKGLPNFPSGIPFTFWEQYIHLRSNLLMALACALGAIFVVVGLLLLNIWAAILVVITLAAMVLQLLGAMALLGINLSAIPAVQLIVAVGIGVHFTVHICLSFVTSIGGRDRRARLALEHMFAPVTHGAITSLLAVVMLAMSDFNFVTRYFFCILLTLIAIGFVNGLVFFPILLSLVGPAAEVIPLEHPDRISTPSPKCSPVRTRRGSGSTPPPLHHSRPRPSSLSTITEEPRSHSHSSLQSIVVQPEVVVETTTYNTDTGSSSGRSTPTNKSSVGGITTKVTATANIKVEVHTPVSSERSHSRRSYYSRDDRDRDRDSYDRDYYNRDYRDRNRDRDSRERDRDNRDRDKDRRKDRDSDRSYRESRRDRDRYRDRDSNKENGRDSGHESDNSRYS